MTDATPQCGLFAEEHFVGDVIERVRPFKSIYVHFEGIAELNAFARLVKQQIGPRTPYVWFPKMDVERMMNARYVYADGRAGPEEGDDDAPDPLPGCEVDVEQLGLFGDGEWWSEYWKGMPEFVQEDQKPSFSITVHFEHERHMQEFSALVAQPLTRQTRSIWHPAADEVSRINKRYRQVDDRDWLPRYPVYVISKGRWESRKTVRALERMRVPYHVVVEPQEFDEYAQVIAPEKILPLPFMNLGQGSIPARNFVWEHSISRGAKRHWILDDNILEFYRLHLNMKVPCETGVMFRAAEDFVDRYENVGIAGFQYWMFAPRKNKLPPLALNTRIYSCILLRNDLPYRWRGRYNEDTDLSLRALKDGWSTVLFYAFIADKATTMAMKGGNTDELYKDDGRLLMAQSLQEQHPDVTKITWKWGRWQHSVDYRPFRANRLRLRGDVAVPEGVDNYGMMLECDDPEEAKKYGALLARSPSDDVQRERNDDDEA